MADTAPVVFKRKGAKVSQRARLSDTVGSAEGAEDTSTDANEDSPSVVAAKLKNKLKSRTKPKSTLSFGAEEDEGEGEVFKVKKSNLSQKLTLGKSGQGNAKASNYNPTAATRLNDGPVYSAAYLSELKAATPTARPNLTEDDSTLQDSALSMDVDSVDRTTTQQALVDLTGDVDMDTLIPSSSAITAAKEKRDRLRKTGNPEDDFISLSVSKRSDYSQGPHPESRLVREDDEVGEGDDEYAEYTSAQERIALGKKSRKVEAQKRRVEMSEMIVDAEEEDEETQEWEQEQLRRGGLRAESTPDQAVKPAYKPAAIPAMTPIPTLGPAIARLTAALTALTTSHAQNTTTMSTLADERVQLDIREKEMRDMIVKAEDKRSWFAAFREWIESVATFLDEKYPQVEKLEEEHISLLQERYDMVKRRRMADDEDDLSMFLGAIPAAIQQADTDELGRVIPQANPDAARKERKFSRNARRILRRAKQNKQVDEEGFSTDSSLPPSDKEDFDVAMEKLLAKRKEVLVDVRAKDFKDPAVGLSKWFGEWRDKFGDSYTGAWGGLGMVGAWEFWTRLEIVGWNPLEDTRSLDTFAWYASLYEYSRPSVDDDEPELGPDGDLVSAMISTALIPRLCKIIEGCAFDPYSAKHVRTLVDITEQIEASVDREDLKFQMLLKSVFIVFQQAVQAAESTLGPYLQQNNPRFDPEAIPARRRYLNRLTKLLSNIVRWRKYSKERYGIGMLLTTLSTNCMLPVAESGWEVGGEDVMRKIASMLPSELVSDAIQARLSS